MRVLYSYILMVMGLCLAMSIPALAQGVEHAVQQVKGQNFASFIRKATGRETIGMVYYKVAGKQPDFRSWATASRKVQDTPEYDRDVILLGEFNRLQNKFVNYQKDDPIHIHGAVDLSNYSEIKETLFLQEIHPTVFFPYQGYDRSLALVVKGIERFSALPLTRFEAADLYEKLGSDKKATIEMTVLPELAEHDNPLVINKQEYWPILTKMAEFIIWSGADQNAVPLWTWRANWYEPKTDKALQQLFKN